MKMELRSRAIDKVYKRRDKIEMPDFQREEVWPESKKQLLVDSILHGWHLPKFYFKKQEDGSVDCVDGQQRLTAIFEFFDEQLVLSEPSQKEFGATIYSDLPDEVSDAFDDFEIEIEEIEDATSEELEELFRRLQLGTPLNTAEKINAVLGDIRDFCHDCAKLPFLKEKLPVKNTRFTHFEIVARWAFIESRGIQPQMRLKQLEEFFKANKTFSKESDVAKRIIGALRFLNTAFDTKPSFVANRANSLSVCMLASKVVGAGLNSGSHAKEFAGFLKLFFSQLSAEVQKGVQAGDKELLQYQQAISSGSTGGDSISTRIRILEKRLATHSSSFSPLLKDNAKVQSQVENSLTTTAKEIQSLVYKVNKAYSARNGEDLFKMTNESVRALTQIPIPCDSMDAYGKFIDALYVLVYEGSGSCKRFGEPPPDFLMDVKFLRTALRHDVDHGGTTDYAKKTKRASEVFKKYSTKPTPEECGPTELLAAQAQLLSGVIELLKGIRHPQQKDELRLWEDPAESKKEPNP